MKLLVVGYAVLVLAAAGLMHRNRPGPSVPATAGKETGEETMQWAEVKTVKVPARPAGIWTWAVDPIQGPARVQIAVADGATWTYSPGRTCGADGDLTALLSTGHALDPTSPIGALLVKIGGSTAGAADGTIRVAGARTYFEIPEKITAPIFLTINDELSGLSDNAGELQVTISIHPLARPASGAAPATPPAAAAPDAAGPAPAGSAGPATGAS
jgi:hypothetical protein